MPPSAVFRGGKAVPLGAVFLRLVGGFQVFGGDGRVMGGVQFPVGLGLRPDCHPFEILQHI